MQQRSVSVDIAKGIAILSVILAHAVPQERDGLREMIYSFHMPLFFILSGFTSGYSTSLTEVRQRGLRIIKKLGIPMLLLWIVFAITAFITKGNSYATVWEFVTKKLLQLLYASGVTNSQLVIFGGGNIEALGIPWFFAAMIGAKIIYDAMQLYLKKYILLAGVIIVTCVGVFAGTYYHFPLSIDISMAVVFFLWVGHILKRTGIRFNLNYMVIALICWAVLWTLTNRYGDWGLELAGRSYPLFPLCFIEAVAGTIVMMYLSEWAGRRQSKMTSLFVFLGRNSLLLLIIHCLDYLWKDLYSVYDHIIVEVSIRITIDVLIFYAVYKVRDMVKQNLTLKNVDAV